MPDEKRIGIKLYVDDGELKEAYKNIERLEKDTVTIKCDYDPDTKKLIADTEAALKQLEKQPASKIKFELDTSALQKSLKEVQSLAKKSAAEIQAAFDKATKPRTNAGLRKSVLGKASFSSDAEEASEELLKYREAAIKKVQDVKIDLDDPTAEINVQKIYDYGKALSELRSVLLDVQSVADKKGLKLPDIDASFGIEETTKKFKELQKNTPSLIQNFSKAEIERLTNLYSDMSNQLMSMAKGFNTTAGKGTAGATDVFDDMAAGATEAADKVKGSVDEIKEATASMTDKPVGINTGDITTLISLLENLNSEIVKIRESFGTIDDGADVQPLLTSVQQLGTYFQSTTSEVRELASAISGIDFNINLNMNDSRNPVEQARQSGIAAREAIEKQKKAYEELLSLLGHGGNSLDIFKGQGNLVNRFIEGSELTVGKSLSSTLQGYQQMTAALKEAAEIKGIDLSQWKAEYESLAVTATNSYEKIASGEQRVENAAQKLFDIFGKSQPNVNFEAISADLEKLIATLNEAIAASQKDVLPDLKDTSGLSEMKEFDETIKAIKQGVIEKTEAFSREGSTVASAVSKEVEELNKLKDVIDKIGTSVSQNGTGIEAFVKSIAPLEGIAKTFEKVDGISSVLSNQSNSFISEQLKQINQAKAKYSRAGIKDLSNLDLIRDVLNENFNFAALSQMGDAGAINEAIGAYVSMFSEITREYDEMIAHMRGNKLQDAFGTGIDTTLKKVQDKIGKYADTDFINADNLERIRAIMGQLESYKELDLISESDEKDVKNLTSELNNLVKNLTKADNLRFNNKGSFIGSLTGTNADRANMENMIKTYDKLKDKQIEFTKWTGDWNKQVTATFTARGSDGTLTTYAATFDKATGAVRMLQKAETEYVSGFSKFVSSIKGKFAELTRYITILDVVQKAFQAFKQGIQAVKDIDAAMTELKKVTDETENAYARFGETAGKIATEVGSTRKEITNSTADFARLGYSMDDATELARVAAIYKNVGDGIDIDTATEDIISTMKAFGIEADRSMEIIDKLNEVGRRVIAHLRSNVQIIKVAI